METKRGLRRWVLKQVMLVILVAVALFLSAGTVRWLDGWISICVIVLIQGISGIILYRQSPDLLVERSKLQGGTKSWDIFLSLTMAFSTLIFALAAGWIYRVGGGNGFNLPLQVVGILAAFAGAALTAWAMYVNHFFSGTVRIQGERGHHAITEGPYKIVRHPGYLGAILFYLAEPLILRVPLLFAVAGLIILVTFIRTYKEDRVLQAELPGYSEFTRSTTKRLIPGIW